MVDWFVYGSGKCAIFTNDANTKYHIFVNIKIFIYKIREINSSVSTWKNPQINTNSQRISQTISIPLNLLLYSLYGTNYTAKN